MSIFTRSLNFSVIGFIFHIPRKTFCCLLVVLTLQSSLFISSCFAQDHPVNNPTLVPFQPNASTKGNDEQFAIQLYQSMDFEKAAEVFQQLYDKTPSTYYYSYLLFCLVEMKEYGKAERLALKQQKNDKRLLNYLVDLGYIYYREGNIEKSKKHYEEAIKKLEPDQMQIINLANAFITKRENEYAVRTYLRGRTLMNNAYPFSFELAAIFEREGETKSAIGEYLNLLEINRSYLNLVEDKLQNILADDKENEKSEVLRTILLGRVQKDPDKTYYSELLCWYSLQQKDFGLALIQAKSLDRRLRENGERIMEVASLAVANSNYEVALDAYGYMVSKGPGSLYYDQCRVELLNTRYLKILADALPEKHSLETLQKDFTLELQKFGENASNLSLMRNLAHLEAFYLGNPTEATEILDRAIDIPGLTETERSKCKMELADILLFTGDVWEATLLYQQVYKDFKNDVLGQEAKFKNARLSFYIGEFEWARAQLDILKAATSKFIANDAIALSLLISENYDPDSGTVALGMFARGDLLDYRNEEELAIQSLDSVPGMFPDHPIMDKVLYKKAAIFQKKGLTSGADSLLEIIVRDYPDGVMADEALMERAKLNDFNLDNKQKAKEIYQELMNKYPSSIYVPEARKRFRALRGDNNQ